ncbi:hypothetical protein NMG60_11021897 [Bertholletia excelsa]
MESAVTNNQLTPKEPRVEDLEKKKKKEEKFCFGRWV